MVVLSVVNVGSIYSISTYTTVQVCVRSYANHHFSPESKNVLWHVHNMHSGDYRSSCLPYAPGIVFIFVIVYVCCFGCVCCVCACVVHF